MGAPGARSPNFLFANMGGWSYKSWWLLQRIFFYFFVVVLQVGNTFTRDHYEKSKASCRFFTPIQGIYVRRSLSVSTRQLERVYIAKSSISDCNFATTVQCVHTNNKKRRRKEEEEEERDCRIIHHHQHAAMMNNAGQ